MSEPIKHGYTTVSCINGIWYTLIQYDDGGMAEFWTTECIASDGRF